MTRNPCDKNCSLRNPSCHSTCEKYLKWTEIHENERQKEKEFKAFYAHGFDYKYRPSVRRDSGIYD